MELNLMSVTRSPANVCAKMDMVEFDVITAHQVSTTTLNVFHATAHQLEAFKLSAITLENVHVFRTSLANVAINV